MSFNLAFFAPSIALYRGVYPPWVVEANQPPTLDGPRRGLWHDIRACIIPITARRNDQSSDNYWGCKAPKNRRRRGGKVEQFEIYHYSLWAQTMQWLKWFINTGEVLLKFATPCPSATLPISFSPLSYLSYNSYKVWGLGMQSYKLIQHQGCTSAAEAQLPAIFMHFRLKLSHLVQYK